MFSNLKVAFTVLGVLISGGVAQAANSCSNNSLQGQYAFKVVGVNVGVYDQVGVLHPFASPLMVTAVGQFTFDGEGSFKRVDFNVSNGAPTINATTPLTANGFRTGQTGTYAVASDCTGVINLSVPGGREIQIAIAMIGYGKGVYGVVAREHAPSLPAALLPAGTSCAAGCDLGDNIALDLTQNASRQRPD